MSNVDKIINQLQNNVLNHMIMLYTGEGYIQLYSPKEDTSKFINNIMKMKNHPDFIRRAILYSFMYKLLLMDDDLQLTDKQIYNNYKVDIGDNGKLVYNMKRNKDIIEEYMIDLSDDDIHMSFGINTSSNLDKQNISSNIFSDSFNVQHKFGVNEETSTIMIDLLHRRQWFYRYKSKSKSQE